MITSSSSSHGSERIMEKAQREASQPVWRFLAGLRKLDLRVSNEEGRLRVSAPPGVLTAELREELAARKEEILDFLRESRILNGEDGPLLHPVPGYPFERQRYWIERPSEPESAAEAPAPMAPQKLALQDWAAIPVATERSSASRASRPARPIMGARTECEEQIVDLWRQVLGVEEVDIRENFLELGGNSLMAVQLISRVRDVFEVNVPVGEFLRAPTVIGLAEAVALCQAQADASPSVEELLSEIESLGTEEAGALLAREIEIARCEEVNPTMVLAPQSQGSRLMEFSLFFFSGDESAFPNDKYQLVLEATRFADCHGFTAVWTPERHFHRFGGLYPNPAVLGAALAAITKRTQIRGGSVIAPLQSPIRIAEEWALVDSLSHGRTGIAFASGFHPVDFVLSPERFKERWRLTAEVVEEVRRYWRGEPVRGETGTGERVERVLFPKPVQRELPTWLTATRATDTFIQAGKIGANVLTALLRINRDEMAEKIAAYRRARSENGHDPDCGKVTLMLHAFLGSDDQQVRRTVSGPFREYLCSHLEFLNSTGAPLSSSQEQELISLAFDRFYKSGSLFGTPESCWSTVQSLAAMGVNEIACLIDFGIDFDATMGGLHSSGKALRSR